MTVSSSLERSAPGRSMPSAVSFSSTSMTAVCALPPRDAWRACQPSVPPPAHVVKRMLELAEIKPGEFMMDLGSGDGRIAIAAARDHGARAVGIDIDPQRVTEANERAQKMGVSDKVTIRQGDLFEADIKDATVVTLYLLQSLNIKLMPKLKALKPGTRIVSHSFHMGDEWPAEKTETVNGRSIFYWTIK